MLDTILMINMSALAILLAVSGYNGTLKTVQVRVTRPFRRLRPRR